MSHMNFSPKWKRWMMEYVFLASAKVLVNANPSGVFKLERGLRQGDPLSPFLYLIVAEGLSVLVNRAVETRQLESAELGHQKLKISHIQYADDMIFLTSGDPKNW